MQKIRKHSDPLLSRDDFRRLCLERDVHKCVICGRTDDLAVHHIIERRCFSDGGYYVSNGSTLCPEHHIQAEQTTLTVEDIRAACKIDAPAIPDHLYPDERYDKWTNIILPNKTRTKGELFFDESVQKILSAGGVLNQFTDHVKYPRTLHLPWSPGATDDDRVHQDLSHWEGEEVVVTEKMDGENTNLYTDYYHARSLDSNSHHSQSWARAFHAQFGWQIPKGWRVCAENLYAKHSIGYDRLKSYLQVFSIWNEHNACLSWDETLFWCELLGLEPVPVLDKFVWTKETADFFRGHIPDATKTNMEGYVIRPTRSFAFSEFRKVVGKYVRKCHVQTTHHWKSQAVVPNKLA